MTKLELANGFIENTAVRYWYDYLQDAERRRLMRHTKSWLEEEYARAKKVMESGDFWR